MSEDAEWLACKSQETTGTEYSAFWGLGEGSNVSKLSLGPIGTPLTILSVKAGFTNKNCMFCALSQNYQHLFDN